MSRDERLEALCGMMVDMGFQLHRDLGPGLLESAYEMILAEQLRARGVSEARQVPIKVTY